MKTPADFRAQLARDQKMTRYELAGKVRVHPGRLGMMLNEKLPMPPDVALRIAEALADATRAE